MTQELIIQGRHLSKGDLEFIKNLIRDNPTWSRYRLSIHICEKWEWFNALGQMKDMACRTMMLKLDKQCLITLPAPRQKPSIRRLDKNIRPVFHERDPIECSLRSIQPLTITTINPQSTQYNLYAHLLSTYHYLGYNGSVGESIRYLIHDCDNRLLACLLFGSCAWSVKCRDAFIGWTADQRKGRLPFITNNMRFLIMPWVSVPCLASHILGHISRRIRSDWVGRYGHPIYMLETFVQTDRFVGTCYKAANWIHVGRTIGRSRNDRANKPQVPIKDVYVYPLVKRATEKLVTG